jgi:acyl dehydratase
MAQTWHFEDFTVGRRVESAAPREVSDALIRAFAEISGDKNPVHLDDAFAAATPFGKRVAHGLLGLSMASGLLYDLEVVRETIVAFRSLEWAFREPIFPGDKVSLRLEVLRARALGAATGLLVCKAELLKQDGQVVQRGEWSVVVKRRG